MSIRLIDANSVVRAALEVGGAHWLSGLLQDIELQHRLGNPTIYVWDGYNSLAVRRAIDPRYKRQRINKPKPSSTQAGLDLCRDLVKMTRAVSIEVPHFEADDVIATLARHYQAKGQTVHVESRDRDFLPLASPTCTVSVSPHPRCPTELIVAFKCLVGDSSDNIIGCPRFGLAGWHALLESQGDERQTSLYRRINLLVTTAGDADRFPNVVNGFRVHSRVKKALLLGRRDIVKAHRLVSFIEIPIDLIQAYSVAGTNEADKLEATLKRFHLDGHEHSPRPTQPVGTSTAIAAAARQQRR